MWLRKRIVKSPKLHFHDTGLACWLLGIRTSEQLSAHPLRGAVFETWVASEVRKHRLNRGDARGLSFFRTRDGAETDLMLERSAGPVLVEAKAGTTPSSHLFDGSRRVRKLLADTFPSCELAVVYGGEEAQNRSVGKLIPWRQLHEDALLGAVGEDTTP